MRALFSILAWLTALAGGAGAQNLCRFYLANQSAASQGFTLSLEAQPNAAGGCSLNTVNLNLAVGDGSGFHHFSVAQSWQTGVVYVVKAVITAAGPQQLSLNGQSLGSAQGLFKPVQSDLQGSQISLPQAADPAYLVTQISLQVANGPNTVSIAPNGSDPTPLPLVLLAGGGALWQAPFSIDSTQPVTITAAFRFDAAVSTPHQFDPYVDEYGQTTKSSWPFKVNSDSDLQAAIAEEQAWLTYQGPLGGMDIYGGSTLAGWTDKATGYYHTALHSNRWWLISPLGNPLFYIGLTGIYEDSTPVTGRESMFASLPASTGQFAPAYSQNLYGDTRSTTYFSFATSNLIRKYGSGWRDAKNSAALQRISSWGFAGSGKWTHTGPGLTVPVNPVLNRTAVPNVVPAGHPDVFDPKIVSQLKSTLAQQIGSDATNAYILGWSVGNEKDEIVGAAELQAILTLGASTPAKKALVDHALAVLYSGSVSTLSAAWKITASTAADVYAANPVPPSKDIEALRQYYEQNYYSTLYQTIKSIDPNHLYLGSWILPRDFPADWPVTAANCDVIGMDLYAPSFLEPDVVALISGSNKPVLIGEFSYPPAYGGMRGFGSDKYAGEITLSDSASGDLYTQWLHDTAANPYIVGLEWFDYRDEPISGRGNNSGGNISSSLVIGESFAFGMTDIADRPKYDLVNKVRAANITALQSLGLLGSAPVLTSAPANGATYLAGGLVPGSWAEVKGTNLSDVTRIWQDSDFAGLGNKLPTNLSGVQVLVNGTAAALYYVSPGQVSFQVPAGVSGAAGVQVTRDGIASNALTAQAVSNSPGIFPVILGATNYAAGVFPDGKLVGDPSTSSAVRKARPGDSIALFATGLAPSPAGAAVTLTQLSGVTVTSGGITVAADFAGLVAAGEFQINFKVPQDFANMPEGNYPISISMSGVSSPSTINSNPPAPLVLPVQH